MAITFLCKNFINDAVRITENCVSTGFGTFYLHDDDLNSVFRGTNTLHGTTWVRFDFGSAVYLDSVACITNLSSFGTLVIRAGNTTAVMNQAFGIPLDGYGTSHKFFGNNGYQYWRLDLTGATGIGKHQINELFLGKRISITEMPTYPLENGIEEDTTELVSERGQKWIYHNYSREYWVLNFESINSDNENKLYNMYRSVRKDTQPFWMALDPENNPNDIKFVRLRDSSFLSEEITKNTFDVSLEIEKEI